MRAKTPGQAFDGAVLARKHLGLVHGMLGVVGAFSFWGQSPAPHMRAFSRGAGFGMIVLSILGWGPYLISWLYSRSRLDGSTKGVLVFSIGAATVTIVGAGLYQNVLALQMRPPSILVSAMVSLSLIVLAKLCSLIFSPSWKS
jgi:hypothetical protein